jgi:nitrogen-specific signal transduction histidine kinase
MERPLGSTLKLTKVSEFEFAKQQIEMLLSDFKRSVQSESAFKIAAQVCHDIRSPLSALEMVSSCFADLPEDQRLIIRNSINRIRDIANSLSTKTNNPFVNDVPVSSDFQKSLESSLHCELLMPVVDLIVTEKRLQYRDNICVQIEFDQSESSYGLFSKINNSELKRILSNLINNSVESFASNAGIVSVDLHSLDGFNVISIVDNGCGIPEDVLERLGSRGVSFNKVNGSGLGLYHAISTLQSWGGRLEIDSEVGKGTKITIYLPKEKTPEWFVPSLKIKNGSKIIVFDDDHSVHQVWSQRIKSLVGFNFEVLHFTNPVALRTFYRSNFAELDGSVFLMDYEIINHAETGLSLIQEFGISENSVLVTSHFEDLSVRTACRELGVPIIPKSMCGFVPFEIVV